MKIETYWDRQIKNYFESGDKAEVIPGYFEDILKSIENKENYSIDNFKIHTVLCGGITYIQFGKKQIASITRNFHRDTYSIVVVDDLLKNKKEKDTDLALDLLFYIIIHLLGITEEMIKKYQTKMPEPCQLGYYIFPHGELEFA